MELLDLQTGQFETAEVAAAKEAGKPVADGDEARCQKAQQEENGSERPQAEESDSLQDGPRRVVQPTYADCAEDHCQQQHTAHAEQYGEHPTPVHVTGTALGGEPADCQTGETGGEKHHQRRKADDHTRQQGVGDHGNDDDHDTSNEGVADDVQRDVVAGDGGATPPQHQHEDGGQTERRRGA